MVRRSVSSVSFWLLWNSILQSIVRFNAMVLVIQSVMRPNVSWPHQKVAVCDTLYRPTIRFSHQTIHIHLIKIIWYHLGRFSEYPILWFRFYRCVRSLQTVCPSSPDEAWSRTNIDYQSLDSLQCTNGHRTLVVYSRQRPRRDNWRVCQDSGQRRFAILEVLRCW